MIEEKVARPAAPASPAALAAFAGFYGRSDPLEAMRMACEELRARAREDVPPVGMRSILRALCADQVTGPTKHLSGGIGAEALLSYINGRFLVRINSASGWRRARFSVAHEAGHLILMNALADRPELIPELHDPNALPQVEKLCDFAARELLMPSADVRLQLHRFGFTPDGLDVLFERYDVSRQVVFIRIAELLAPASVTVWRSHVRHGDGPKRRVIGTFGEWRQQPLWLPKGISDRRLSTDLLSRAILYRASSEAMLQVQLDDREIWGRALAAAMPAGDRRVLRLPLRLRTRPAQERISGGEVALLLTHPDATRAWTQLRGHGQLQLPFDVPSVSA